MLGCENAVKFYRISAVEYLLGPAIREQQMARIYVSYNHSDAEVASQISMGLKALGHQITLDVESLAPGQDWRRALMKGLKASEVFVTLITENSLGSQYVMHEIGAARAFSQTSNEMLVIPVILGHVDIPAILRDIHVIQSPDRDVNEICQQIDRGITAFAGRRAAHEKLEGEVKDRIEANAPQFIDEAIQSLSAVERRCRFTGNVWYAFGFAALVLGVCFGFYSVSQASATPSDSWIHFAYIALKTVIIIGLLGACAKYSFTLGKSYTSESLKSADRLHAISFGRFFLRVYGTKASWPELKEAFQHWNIDRRSSFVDLDANQFDPKLIESAVELVRIIAGKQEAKK